MIINVRDYVAAQKEIIKNRIKDWKSAPSLLIIQVGDNPASNSYVKGKIKDCEEVGIEVTLEKHEEDWFYQNGNLNELQETILKYDGVIVQLPIESHLLKQEIYDMISPLQDVDGLIYNVHKPCTPLGIMRLIEHLNIDLKGKVVTVLGKGSLVGKPLVQMLMNEGATVISCNSKTKDLNNWMKQSDIIVAAAGVPKLVTKWSISGKTIIIDAGINFVDGKMCGDCDKQLYDSALVHVTPVPGGVGLLTRLSLLENTVDAAEGYRL